MEVKLVTYTFHFDQLTFLLAVNPPNILFGHSVKMTPNNLLLYL